ncbi:MAG TPA: radical SAM protein [Polyangiaceae bacterium]
METTHGQYHPTRFEDVAVTVDFHCNSACVFCIVQEGMNRYKGLPFERFQALIEENRRSAKYQRVIFTGGEVTLEKSLPSYVRAARDSGSFRYLRLQTNGRRLADPAYAKALVADGLNEFFVSIHGHDASSHDAITQRPGSFDELVQGLDHLRALDVRIITNTVMVRSNVGSLSPIVELAALRGVSRMEFWNYLPMEDQADERGLIAPMSELVPALRAALDRCGELGLEAVVKYVPHCLLGPHADLLDNSQPDVVIVEDFWRTFPKFNCLYEAVCEHSERCLGLHHAYVNRFGWELGRLEPEGRTRPWSEREEPERGRPERYGSADDARASPATGAHPGFRALVEGAEGTTGAVLEKLELTRNDARYLYRLEQSSVEIVVAGRDETTPALARTRSFNVFYTRATGFDDIEKKRALADLLKDFVAKLGERDRGELTLDSRKGLLQLRKPLRRSSS